MRLTSLIPGTLAVRASIGIGLMLGGACSTALADKIKNPTAVFSGLDKITGRIIAFEASVDETVQFGSLQLTARVCYSRPEYENPQTTTFIEVEEVGGDNQYKKIFAGWMFAASPGLNAIEHPIYDVWLTACKGGTEIIKTPPEQDLIEDVPPPVVAGGQQPPKPVTPLPRSAAGPAARNAPLRLPEGGFAPPVAVAPRSQPQQRFFPTNNGEPRRGGGLIYDPAGSGR